MLVALGVSSSTADKFLTDIAKKRVPDALKLGFSDVTPYCYNDGDLTEYQDDLLLAPSLQEVQAWIGRRKRLDVLVYREVFFSEVGKFYAVISLCLTLYQRPELDRCFLCVKNIKCRENSNYLVKSIANRKLFVIFAPDIN